MYLESIDWLLQWCHTEYFLRTSVSLIYNAILLTFIFSVINFNFCTNYKDKPFGEQTLVE